MFTKHSLLWISKAHYVLLFLKAKPLAKLIEINIGNKEICCKERKNVCGK